MDQHPNNEPDDTPSLIPSIVISSALHALLLALVVIISYKAYDHSNRDSPAGAGHVDRQETIFLVTMDNDRWQTRSGRDTGSAQTPGGPLNDEAYRGLLECARSGVSVTPDNFREYARVRELRKSLAVQPRNDIYQRYPFLTGTARVSFGADHKLTSDYRECFADVCRAISLPVRKSSSPTDAVREFTAAVQDYLDDTRRIRTWRTLWTVRKPATRADKIEVVRLLRRLHNYGLEYDDAGFEHLRPALKQIVALIPDDLKYPPHP